MYKYTVLIFKYYKNTSKFSKFVMNLKKLKHTHSSSSTVVLIVVRVDISLYKRNVTK